MQRNYRFGLGVGIVAIAVLFAVCVPASAQVYGTYNNTLPGKGMSDFGIGNLISNMTVGPNSWVAILSNLATHIFVAVAVIEFAWMIVLSFISGRSIGELLGAWVPKMIAFSLFFYFLVLHGVDTAQVLITSFTTAAGATPDGSTGQQYAASPTGLMSEGFNLTWPMMIYAIVFAAIPNFYSGLFFSFGITNMQVPVIFIQMFGATLTIGAYVFLGGTLLITIVEAYLVSVFGLIMSGLSPLRTTHAYGTQKVIGYAISVGVKLLTLYLVIGLIQTVIAPIIAAAAAIPIAGALTVGFYGIILALIAYNVPTFASTIVSGIASGNASAGVSAMTAAAGSATAMAQSMHGISQGIHDKNDSKKLGSEADAKATSEKNMHGGTMEAKQPVVTGLSGHEMPGQKSSSSGNSLSQNSVETKSGSAGAVAETPSGPAHNAQAGSVADKSAPTNSGGQTATDKSLPQDSAGARAAAAQNLPAAPSQPSNGDPKKEDRRTTDQKLQDSYERGYGSKSKEPPDQTTLQARAEFQQLRDQAYKEGDALEKQGIDGFGKGIGQMLNPSGGAASGAVAGATLRSSV